MPRFTLELTLNDNNFKTKLFQDKTNPIGVTMVATTTICIEPEVKELLRGLRIHENESYNSVVKRLVKNAYSDKPYTEEDVKDLETALQEIKEGKYYTHDEVWAEIDKERAEK